MSKQQIVVIRTLVEYTRRVADAQFQPLANGSVTYRVITTFPNGKVIEDATETLPDDLALVALAQKRAAVAWDESDLITYLGI